MSCLLLSPEKGSPKILTRQSHFHSGPDYVDRLPQKLNVSWFDLFCLVAGPIGVLLDVGSDIWVSIFYFRSDQVLFAILVLIFTIVPGLVISIISAIWTVEDWRRQDPLDTRPPRYWKFRLFLTALQLTFVVRYIDALRFAWKFRRRRPANDDRVEIYSRMLEELRDASLLRLVEAFLESAPQLILQLYLMGLLLLSGGRISAWHLYPSVIFSICSLAWSLVSQHRCLRFIREDKNNPTVAGSLMMFLWRLLTLSSRLVALVTFLLCFRAWAALLIGGQYVLMVVWLSLYQDVKVFADDQIVAKIFFRAVIGVVHILTPLNMIEGRTRYRYLWYYSVEAMENFVLTAVPVFLVGYSFWLLVYVAVSFTLGIMAMATYYLWLHPNKTVVKTESLMPPPVK